MCRVWKSNCRSVELDAILLHHNTIKIRGILANYKNITILQGYYKNG